MPYSGQGFQAPEAIPAPDTSRSVSRLSQPARKGGEWPLLRRAASSRRLLRGDQRVLITAREPLIAIKGRSGPGKTKLPQEQNPYICREIRSALGRTRTCDLLIRSDRVSDPIDPHWYPLTPVYGV